MVVYENNGGVISTDITTGHKGGFVQVQASADDFDGGTLSLEVQQSSSQPFYALSDYEKTAPNIVRVELKTGSAFRFSFAGGSPTNLIVSVLV